ncbi:CoA-transferase family III [Melanogaster broomeanus]|nr:CoA-transferase family III [Melanogaster broomeanus]
MQHLKDWVSPSHPNAVEQGNGGMMAGGEVESMDFDGGEEIAKVLLDGSGPNSSTDELLLSGVRVLELGQAIAGPFCGQLLGHFGSDIIKIEPPSGGDPLRVWRELDVDGTSPWFRSLGRKSVAIDLRKDEGRKLAAKSDVVVENFKPGTLEKWGLGPPELPLLNPSLIFTRSGFRSINGFVDPDTNSLPGPPVRPNISLGDSVAGLHAAFRTVLALLSRQKKASQGKTSGQTVDFSVLNLMEGIIPEYDRKGKVRGPSGSSVTGIVPTNAYPCLPSPSTPSSPTYIIIGANADILYARLMRAVGREDLIGPLYAQNHHRVARQAEREEAISSWTSVRPAEEVLAVLEKAGVPVSRVVGVKEIMENEQVKARGAVEDVWVGKEDSGWNVKMPGVFARLEGSEVKTRWAGPDLGEHTDDVLINELGLDANELARLRRDGIIG